MLTLGGFATGTSAYRREIERDVRNERGFYALEKIRTEYGVPALAAESCQPVSPTICIKGSLAF